MKINIVLPVLNEELRLGKGLKELLLFLKTNPEIVYEITIVDNGSTDMTQQIAEKFCEKYDEINYIRIEDKGVGIAFREAVAHNTSDVIGYMDIDLSTDLKALKTTYATFGESERLDIINASRYSKNSVLIGRKWYRNFVSYCLVGILKIVFKMRASDAICGFKFFKKDVIEELMKISSDEKGWFLLIEIILRAEREGYQIKELPVTWVFEEHTKVKIVKVTLNYLKQIGALYKAFRKEGKVKNGK